MTFYWWSHWFWITLLSNILFVNIVHTYPSQEITSEYNRNREATKRVTKLFQTSTTSLWATTAAPTSTQIMDLTQTGTTREVAEMADKEAIEIYEAEALEIESGKNEIQKPHEDSTYMDENSKDYEFKRSAEIDSNRTNKFATLNINEETQKSFSINTHDNSAIRANKKPTVTMTEDDSNKPDIDNSNKKHFSNNFSNLSINSTNVNNTTIATPTTTNSNSPPSAPAVPRINSELAAAEWLHTAAVVPLAASQSNIEEISSSLVTAASASQKVPFTLENANKEDELRRAESEHRSRKSKVLSAEYKHINRYINYSSDSKSLLARSASTAPNDFDGDTESNISSEALAIKRAYFLDAGAISAICFTVFGVCCTVGTIGIVLYRRRYLNKPQTLSEPDSSVYIDDSTMRVSDNSDEMYSLDNDSFLNSLEAMTIQNYWTDTVKHTKL